MLMLAILLIADRSVGAAGDVPPELLSTAIPEYPKAADETGREGTVVLELLIDAEGRVVDARVTKSIPEFDGAALACVSQWRFIPAQQRWRPVPAKVTALVIFKRPSKARPTTAWEEAPFNHDLKRGRAGRGAMWGLVPVLFLQAQHVAGTDGTREDFLLAANQCSMTVVGLRPSGGIDNRPASTPKARRCGPKADRIACVDQMEVGGRRMDNPVHGHDEYSIISHEDRILELRNAAGSYDFITVNEANGTAVTILIVGDGHGEAVATTVCRASITKAHEPRRD